MKKNKAAVIYPEPFVWNISLGIYQKQYSVSSMSTVLCQQWTQVNCDISGTNKYHRKHDMFLYQMLLEKKVEVDIF